MRCHVYDLDSVIVMPLLPCWLGPGSAHVRVYLRINCRYCGPGTILFGSPTLVTSLLLPVDSNCSDDLERVII